MALPPHNLLRIFDDPAPTDSASGLSTDSLIGRLCASFGEATGWSLSWKDDRQNVTSRLSSSAPESPGVGTSLGRGSLEITPVGPNRVKRSAVCQLGTSLAELLDEWSAAQTALRSREAELATGVPVAIRPDDQHIAERLEAVLQGGAESIDCDGAAIYLLDPATSHLKLRAAWGLPVSRLTDAPRPLGGAIADLEALTGHAVVLSDAEQTSHWRIPEPFEAAVCVPVSSGDTPFGTLWIFSRLPRDFSSRQTNLAEIIAGRVAAELQLESLLGEAAQIDQARRQIDRARRWQQDLAPRAVPMLDGWDIAGWSDGSESLGGGFFDWSMPTDSPLVASIGQCPSQGIESALGSVALRFALRSHADYRKAPSRLLESVSQTLWSGSAGNLAAALYCLRINTASGRVQYAAAGPTGAIIIGAGGPRLLPAGESLLGVGPTTQFQNRSERLAAGETLVAYSGLLKQWTGTGDDRLAARALEEAAGSRGQTSAEKLIAILQRLRGEQSGSLPHDAGGSVLVIRRI